MQEKKKDKEASGIALPVSCFHNNFSGKPVTQVALSSSFQPWTLLYVQKHQMHIPCKLGIKHHLPMCRLLFSIKEAATLLSFAPFFHSYAWLVTSLLPRLIPRHRVKLVNKERHLKTMDLDTAFSSWEGFCPFSIIFVKMAHEILWPFFS